MRQIAGLLRHVTSSTALAVLLLWAWWTLLLLLRKRARYRCQVTTVMVRKLIQFFYRQIRHCFSEPSSTFSPVFAGCANHAQSAAECTTALCCMRLHALQCRPLELALNMHSACIYVCIEPSGLRHKLCGILMACRQAVSTWLCYAHPRRYDEAHSGWSHKHAKMKSCVSYA